MAVAEKLQGTTPQVGAVGSAPVAGANGAAKELITIKMADSEKKSVTTALPKQVLDLLKAEATKRDLTDNSVVREIVAAHYGFKITDNKVPRVGKYVGLSKEEAKAARNQANAKQRERMAKILAAIDEGLFTPEQLQKLGIEDAA